MTKIGFLAVAFVPAALACQTVRSERTDESFAKECQARAQSLLKGPSDPSYQRSRWLIDRCTETGPAALSARWQQISGDDREDLGIIVASTRSLRDQRLLESMIRIATDGSRPTIVRLGSLQVLLNYIDPSYDVQLDALLSAETYCNGPLSPTDAKVQREAKCGGIAYLGHDTSGEGTRRFAANSTSTIRRTFRTLAEGDSNSNVRYAAKLLSDGVDDILRQK